MAMSFDEIAARLKTAATAEISSINYLEFFSAKSDCAQLTVVEVRRQAEALALASKIARALAAQPDKAQGLGLSPDDLIGFIS
jgi:hypothetical protein